ncbi:hypothetical protein [Kordiimonas laminariae]|uniref:hypothetical protein n=1 Tax=Kordiimonas laminariae TaxID=2917717 RepID=UPI001FF6D824|nr:hypothetical protein [Kordiimonas laminariae]MCK0069329.1 hypothetical protein [Kordiimonas laminariae]
MRGLPINFDLGIASPTATDLIIRVSIILLALAADFIAGPKLLKILPNIQTIASAFGLNLKSRLDKPSRNRTERFYRGAIVALVLLPVAYGTGVIVNQIAFINTISDALTCLILTPLLAQRSGWKNLQQGKQNLSNYSSNAELLKQTVLSFSGRTVPLSLTFLIGGFALLLPAVLLIGLLFTAPQISADHPQSPYNSGVSLIHEIVFLVPSLVASIFIATALICLPFTKISAALTLLNPATKGLPSTYFPLNIVATGVEICFRIQGSKSVEWIGPKDGRARLQANHLRQGWLCILVANAVYLTVGILLFLYLASLLAQ